jgi:hypothetical protein
MSRLRFGLILLFLLIIGGVVGFVMNYPRSFTNISVETSIKEPIKLYKANNSMDYKYNQNKDYKTFTGNQILRVKRGSYVAIITDPDNIYNQTEFKFTSLSNNFELKINPDYNNAKLTSLLENEGPLIHKVIKSKYPNTVSEYNIAKESLFKQGQWYGALLKSHNPANDSYRIILEKKGDNWVVVTSPPQIIIGQPDYPNIPYDVISGVDSLTL